MLTCGTLAQRRPLLGSHPALEALTTIHRLITLSFEHSPGTNKDTFEYVAYRWRVPPHLQTTRKHVGEDRFVPEGYRVQDTRLISVIDTCSACRTATQLSEAAHAKEIRPSCPESIFKALPGLEGLPQISKVFFLATLFTVLDCVRQSPLETFDGCPAC